MINLKKIFNNSIFVSSAVCLQCTKEVAQNSNYCLCEKCFEKLPRNRGKICNKCGERITSDAKFCLRCKQSPPLFTRCYSPLIYKYPVTNFIQKFKYDNRQYYAKTLGNFLVESYILNNLNCDICVPVPLHKKRLKQRGYNQALLLANQLGEHGLLPVRSDVLLKVVHNQTQTNLTKKERKENVKNVFVVENKHLVNGARVLVVDDVYTTGATLNECAQVLFEAGASAVYCLTLAHTMTSSAV